MSDSHFGSYDWIEDACDTLQKGTDGFCLLAFQRNPADLKDILVSIRNQAKVFYAGEQSIDELSATCLLLKLVEDGLLPHLRNKVKELGGE